MGLLLGGMSFDGGGMSSLVDLPEILLRPPVLLTLVNTSVLISPEKLVFITKFSSFSLLSLLSLSSSSFTLSISSKLTGLLAMFDVM